MADKLYLDFESKSASPLKDEGLHKYVKHCTTKILCVGYAFNNEAPSVCRPERLPKRVIQHIRRMGQVVAHNAPFEFHIWNEVGVRDYGWPKLYVQQLDCTMSRAAAMALPQSLENAAAAVGLDNCKDAAGHRLMMKMSQPRKRHACPMCEQATAEGYGRLLMCPTCCGLGEVYTWWNEPGDLERLMDYCKQDIVVTQELDRRLLRLSPSERYVWELDQRINNRGVAVDVRLAQKARLIVEMEQGRLEREIQLVTDHFVSGYNCHAQLKKWLLSQGVETDGVDKAAVSELLARDSLPDVVRRALEIRQEAAKSSTAKLKAIIARAGADQRVRGVHQYHVAGTGRWGGRGVQTQNFPRPNLDQSSIDDVFLHLEKFSPEDARDYIEMVYGSPMTVISDCLRGFLVAGDGQDLMAADFNSVEARALAWLAEQESALEIFRTHGKIYEAAASDIFNVLMQDVTKFERQVGKTAVLALGFQGGVNAFQSMASAFGITLAPVAESLWARAPKGRREKARWGWEQRGKNSGIGKREWMACELVKLAWREANPNIVAFWKLLEDAAIQAVTTKGVAFFAGKYIAFKVVGSFLFCRLPSGRTLCYPYPEIRETKTSWGEMKQLLQYMSEDSTTHKWTREVGYGGKLAENVTQAVARDLLADAMIRLDSAGFPIALHVHDEAVAEVSEGADLEDFVAIFEQVPTWADGLPMKAEGWHAKRYRK